MTEADEIEARGFGTDVALLVVARLTTVAAFFGVNVVGARLLSPDGLGAAAVGQTIGLIASLVANGGLNIATIYFLQQRPGERGWIVPRLALLGTVTSTLAIVLVIVAAPLVLGLVEGTGWPLMLGAALMAGTVIAFELSGALLLGLGRTRGFAAMELVRGIGSLAAVAVLLIGPLRSEVGFVVGLGVGYASAAAIGLLGTRRGGYSLRPRHDRAFAGEAIRFGMSGQVGNIFAFLGARLDLLLVPALLDLRSAGIYVIAVRISEVVGQAATAASSLVFPRVAAQVEVRSTALTERATRMIVLVVLATALVLAVAGEPILRIAFGDAYAGGSTALLILLAGTLPVSMGRILAADLKGRGRPDLVSWAALITLSVTLALNLALVPLWGIVGAAVASAFAFAASALVLLAAYRRVTGGHLAALVPRPADVRDLISMVARAARARSGAA